jgi:hypothetical protein
VNPGLFDNHPGLTSSASATSRCAHCSKPTGIKVGNGIDWLTCCLDPVCEPLVRAKLKTNIVTIRTEIT